jgi:hypothetical protein
MGTRGLMGFVIDGEPKLAYNHFDSYPSGKGVQILAQLRAMLDSVEATRTAVRKLRMVTDDTPPTDDDIDRLLRFADVGVSRGSLTEWYVLLRNTQGDLQASLAAGAMEDGSAFAGDSLFCEWGYVIDLDAERFEVYQGFQKQPHSDGRFCNLPPDRADGPIGTYYPIRLIASWGFDHLPSDDQLCALEAHEED